MRNLEEAAEHKSLLGNIWQQHEVKPELKEALSKKHALPELILNFLASKFADLAEAEQFLYPTLKSTMQDPFILKDMEKAVKLIYQALKEGKKLAVFGDYDVDGGTSSALLKNYFAKLGHDLTIYIPDRIAEGYGPNSQAFAKLKEQGIDLVITVDCGATSFEPLEAAKQLGLEVIVIDHHLTSDNLPEALAIINPNRADEQGEYSYLSAVGVCFLMLVALQRYLREQEFFKEKPAPDLREFLDLVALGTVCDVVPLVGLNRSYVQLGLKRLAATNNSGLKALLNSAAISDEDYTSYHLGYIIGPRINAGGRVGEASLGAKLLSNTDLNKAQSQALKLEQHNKERKTIELLVQEEAIAQIQEHNLAQGSVLIVAGTNWHPGVIGIVAARLKEKYNLPTAVIALMEDDTGKASARSIKGVDLGNAIVAAREAGLLINGGGHKMAAGFTIAKEKISDFREFLNKELAEQVSEARKQATLNYTAHLAVNALSVDLVKSLDILAPFGMANSEPRFVLSGCKIVNKIIMAEKHLKLIIAEQASNIYGKSIEAIIWQAKDTVFWQFFENYQGEEISLLGKLRINKWQERERVQFEVEDVLTG